MPLNVLQTKRVYVVFSVTLSLRFSDEERLIQFIQVICNIEIIYTNKIQWWISTLATPQRFNLFSEIKLYGNNSWNVNRNVCMKN